MMHVFKIYFVESDFRNIIVIFATQITGNIYNRVMGKQVGLDPRS